jgi:hypothetical protein
VYLFKQLEQLDTLSASFSCQAVLMNDWLHSCCSVPAPAVVAPAVVTPAVQTWSCWMVADPRQGQPGAVGAAKIAHALRHWMGDALTTIKVPAKCAARLGQCFSTTVDAARVEPHQVVSVVCVCVGGCFKPCKTPSPHINCHYCHLARLLLVMNVQRFLATRGAPRQYAVPDQLQ